jgi:moderate conductance mechanosensitive channel
MPCHRLRSAFRLMRHGIDGKGEVATMGLQGTFRGCRLAAVLLTIMVALALSTGLVAAQQAAPSADTGRPAPLTAEAVNDIVARLSDKEARELLLKMLKDDIASPAPVPEPPVTAALDQISMTLERTADSIAETVGDTPETIAAELSFAAGFFAARGWEGTLALLAMVGLALAAGLAVEAVINRIVMRRQDATVPLPEGVERPLPEAAALALRRLARELAGVIAFLAAGTLVLIAGLDGTEERVALICVTGLIFVPRIGAALLRFLLAPSRPDMRMACTDDATAAFLYRNFLGVIAMASAAFTLVALNRLNQTQAFDELAFWPNLGVFVWLVVIAVRAKDGLRQIVRGRGGDQTPGELRAAQAYPAFAVTAIVVTWLVSAILPAVGMIDFLRGGRHLVTLGILLVTPMLDTLLRALVRHLAAPKRGEGQVADRAYLATLSAYTRMSRVLVFGGILLYLAHLWEIRLLDAAAAGMGEQFAQRLIKAVLIVLAGYLAWEVTRLAINRRLAHENTGAAAVGPEDSGPHNAPMSSRLGTILPTVSWAVQIVIIVMTLLMALGALGLDVTPLLAGAGIAGIAIGFGAQKLVTDVISGLFFLADDAFRLNEYIDVGGVQGTVEKISLRSIMLRDSKGPMLCVPYSGIDKVTNFGRDWGIMKLRFTVPFDTDVEKVRKIFKKIGQDMMAMPELAAGFIEPFKGQGVGEFNDVGIVVRSKFTHKPGAQFAIRREIFNRVQAEFAAAGIQFARREVHVNVSGDPSDPRVQAAATGAAATALAVEAEQQAAMPHAP